MEAVSPMVEKVARAIAYRRFSEAGHSALRASEMADRDVADFTADARAAIAAMREPTAEMLSAGGKQVLPLDEVGIGQPDMWKAEGCWKDMIAVALGEPLADD